MLRLIDTQVRDFPVPAGLQAWAEASMPARQQNDSDMLYWSQIMFVRDKLITAVCGDVLDANAVSVVSSHVSKGVLLPVFHIDTGYGHQFWLRNNYYDWKVSVRLPSPVVAEVASLITDAGTISAVNCEGFEPGWVFGQYRLGEQEFTVEITDDYRLWAFCHILTS